MKTACYWLYLLLLFVSSGVFAQTPVISSYPSASATIYLDFDGQYVQGTSWNMSGPLDLGPSNMTAAQITEATNRVAEDFRPFNVNVTTDSTKYWAAPVQQRMRIIVTITSGWYGNVGGVSYLGSFTWGDNTPCFVFSQLLGYNTKSIAEAASHEAGHTLGLRHQSSWNTSCVKLAEYNSGIGSGEISWAPIMGVGYSRNQTLWNNGANPFGCTEMQNDLEVITSNNGFGFRSDDYGSNLGGAASANFINNEFRMTGVIERQGDQDAFKIVIPVSGSFRLNSAPFNVGSGNSGANLDVEVELITRNGGVLGVYNQAAQLNAVIDTFLTAGTYFIRVKGKGNVYAPEYASLGAYNLEGRLVPGGALPVRKLELKATASSGSHRIDWIVEADERIVAQVLEVSADGTSFQPLTQPGASARSFQYRAAAGNLQYRLLVNLEDGRSHYSNVATVRGSGDPLPQLIGNPVKNAMIVKTGAAIDYTIVDLQGRPVQRGRVGSGTISVPVSDLLPGMYVVEFSHGLTPHREKFIKQ